MKSCKNCYYYDKCTENEERCEYYDPVVGAENIVLREYEEDLTMRAKEYQSVVDEQQS